MQHGHPIHDRLSILVTTGRSYGTIRGWLVRAAERGLDGLYDIRHGAPCRLDGIRLARLRKDLIAGP